MPKFKETPFREILEGCAIETHLTEAEIEDLADAHCRIARAGQTFVRNDLWSGMNEQPEPEPYAHFDERPYFAPEPEDLKSTLERLKKECGD